MNSTIQATFLYSHFNNDIVEDTHFKSIIRLKSSTPEDVIEKLFFNMANNQVNVSKEYITTYLNKYISTNFFNEDLKEDIEEHIIRHNDNFLIFTFDNIDNSVEVKYLSNNIVPILCTPSITSHNTIREHCDFNSLDLNTIESNTKEKKRLLGNILGVFKKKSKKSESIEA